MHGALNIEYIYINLSLKFSFAEFITLTNPILSTRSIFNREKEPKHWYMYIHFVIPYLRVTGN